MNSRSGTPDPSAAGTGGSAVLELRHVTRTFGRGAGANTALNDVSLTVAEGRSLGIVGESGAGKSTILNLLLALDRPTSGEVWYRGAPLHPRGGPITAFRRDVQIVFQDPRSSLNPRMRVGQIIAEPLRSLGIEGDRRARVREVLEAVGLDQRDAVKYPAQFSGGQRQRIAIARALAPSPRVLVADEPVSALDVSVRSQIVALLQSLIDDLGMTLVMVSHDVAIVGRLCDDVAVLQGGRLVEQGETVQVLNSPASDYTAQLVAAVPRLPQ